MKKKSSSYLVLLLFVLISFSVFGQEKKNPEHVKPHSPGRAMLYSIIPGGGQIYNQKYWKVPVLYAGLAATVYAIDFNNVRYERFKEALEKRSDEDYDILTDKYKNLSDKSLENLSDSYRNDRDLSIFIGVGIYAINILDAYVDAHFFEFDVSDDLSLQIQPSIQLTPDANAVNGINLCLRF